jgi:hypothetical protein
MKMTTQSSIWLNRYFITDSKPLARSISSFAKTLLQNPKVKLIGENWIVTIKAHDPQAWFLYHCQGVSAFNYSGSSMLYFKHTLTAIHTTINIPFATTLSPYNPFLIAGCTVNYQDAPPRGQTITTRPERPFFGVTPTHKQFFFVLSNVYLVKNENRGVRHWCTALPLSLQQESKKSIEADLLYPRSGIALSTKGNPGFLKNTGVVAPHQAPALWTIKGA